MANKNKRKGSYHERWFIKWLEEQKIEAKKVPLSGSLGGEYSGGIKLEVKEIQMVGEVKYRDKSNFPNPFSVLEGRDIAFYKRRRGTPQTLVIMSGEVFEKLMENSNANSNESNQSPS